MAIDTKAKRFQMLNFGDGSVRFVLPDPDGTLAAADRAHLLDLYGGISLISITWTSRGPKLLYESDRVPTTIAAYWEQYIGSSSGTVYGRCFDVTAAAAVANTEISTLAAIARVRAGSSATLVDGHEYQAQTGKPAGAAGTHASGRFIFKRT